MAENEIYSLGNDKPVDEIPTKGKDGKAYEDNRPSHTCDVINDTWNNNNNRTRKVKGPVSKEEIDWKPGENHEKVSGAWHKHLYKYRHPS